MFVSLSLLMEPFVFVPSVPGPPLEISGLGPEIKEETGTNSGESSANFREWFRTTKTGDERMFVFPRFDIDG